jgi:hypothetical protein
LLPKESDKLRNRKRYSLKLTGTSRKDKPIALSGKDLILCLSQNKAFQIEILDLLALLAHDDLIRVFRSNHRGFMRTFEILSTAQHRVHILNLVGISMDT